MLRFRIGLVILTLLLIFLCSCGLTSRGEKNGWQEVRNKPPGKAFRVETDKDGRKVLRLVLLENEEQTDNGNSTE